MSEDHRPLVGFVVVEVDYSEDRDRPIHSFVSSPYPTREDAEREKLERERIFEQHIEEEGELYDEKDFSISEIHVHSLDRLRPMDEEHHEVMTEAADALAAGLLEGVKDP